MRELSHNLKQHNNTVSAYLTFLQGVFQPNAPLQILSLKIVKSIGSFVLSEYDIKPENLIAYIEEVYNNRKPEFKAFKFINLLPADLWEKIGKFLDNKNLAAFQLAAPRFAASTYQLSLDRLGSPRFFTVNNPTCFWGGEAYYWGYQYYASSPVKAMPTQIPLPYNKRIAKVISTTDPHSFLTPEGDLYSLSGKPFRLPFRKKVKHVINTTSFIRSDYAEYIFITQPLKQQPTTATSNHPNKNSNLYACIRDLRKSNHQNPQEYQAIELPSNEQASKLFILKPNHITYDTINACYFCTTNLGKNYAFGFNENGQLGIGNLENKIMEPSIVKLPEDETIEQLLLEEYPTRQESQAFIFFIACITQSKNLYIWGGAWKNRHSTQAYDKKIIPEKIPLPKGEIPRQIFGSSLGLFCLTDSSKFFHVANEVSHQLKFFATKLLLNEEKVTHVRKHDSSLFLRTEAGCLYKVSRAPANSNETLAISQLTFPEGVKIARFFSYKNTIGRRNYYGQGANLNNIQHHFFVLTTNRELYSWGNNDYGELGLGHNNFVATPTKVNTPGNKKIKNILLTHNYILLCRTEDGELFSCGKHEEGYLGLSVKENQSTLQKISFPEKIVQIFPGPFCFGESGQLYSWGNGPLGRKGNLLIPGCVSIFQRRVKSKKALITSLIKNRSLLFGDYPKKEENYRTAEEKANPSEWDNFISLFKK